MYVAVIDNDALVKLFAQSYEFSKRLSLEILDIMLARFSAVWVPRTIASEFIYDSRSGKRAPAKLKKRRKKVVTYLKRASGHRLTDCPVRVSQREIDLAITNTVDPGEADAVLQIKKTLSSDRFPQVRRVYFISDDSGALEYARREGIEFVPLDEVRTSLRQAGIPVPD